jgi:hypothetical protein
LTLSQRNARVLAVGAAASVSSVSAFAQASGTTINDSAIVSSIGSVATNVADIGGAVLSIVVVAWGYKMVKGFIGR